MRKALASLAFGLALGAAGPALAGPPIAALVPDGGGAAFEVKLPEGQAIARGDGASLVACGAVLVTAADGSRASITCGDTARIALSAGAFRLVAGAKGAAIRLGETELRATNVRVWAVLAGERWLVRFERDGDQGAVEIDGAALAPGEIHALGPAEAAGADDAGSKAAFEKAAARLGPRREAGRALVPRRVESAGDYQASAAASAADGGEIELEAIEVEAGCIEVCVD